LLRRGNRHQQYSQNEQNGLWLAQHAWIVANTCALYFVHAPLSWLRPSVLRRSRHNSVSQQNIPSTPTIGPPFTPFHPGKLYPDHALYRPIVMPANSTHCEMFDLSARAQIGPVKPKRRAQRGRTSDRWWHVFVGSGYGGMSSCGVSLIRAFARLRQSPSLRVSCQQEPLGSSPSGVNSSGSSSSRRKV
jgi:hypothetical protein